MERFYAELRSALDGDKMSGHAAVFNVMAKLPNRYEELASTAFERVLDNDVRALVNHNPSALLARTKAGTMKIGTDSSGLYFEIPKLPNTTHANDLRESIERGDLDGCSFGFQPDEDTYRRAPDGLQVRTHTYVKLLLDVSPCTYPAYQGTELHLRNQTFEIPATNVRTQMLKIDSALLMRGK